VRTLFVTGPGGAGTSTLSAAAAVGSARAGRRTLLLTRQRPVGGLDAVPGLTVTVVDAQSGVERFWSVHAPALTAVLPQLDLPPASSVVAPPGAAELALLTELARADADVVVVDAGPVEVAVPLAGLPAALQGWLDQLVPARLRALAALAGVGGAAGAALAAVPALEELLRAGPLADPGSVEVLLAAWPRRGAAAALRRTVTGLALHGLRPAAVLPRVLPAGDGPWWAERTAEQEAALAELAELAPVTAVAELPVLSDDADAVVALLDGFEPAAPSPAARPAPERTAAGWDLAVPLPFADRGDVELTRFGDDLVLTAAGTRRSLRLDALLRRCAVTGGRLADPGTPAARLVVGFEPDPRLWPADLLAAHGGAR
jgi:arsenite-transporting ATPase